MDGLKHLNSECFTHYNYESNWWNVLEVGFEQSMNQKTLMDCVKKFAVGYCESEKVLIRPRPNAYAVMFEKNGERFWFHIEKWELETE